MKKGKKNLHPSMIRSRFKKERKLPTRPIYDPFVKTKVYINKNGRCIALKKGLWVALT